MPEPVLVDATTSTGAAAGPVSHMRPTLFQQAVMGVAMCLCLAFLMETVLPRWWETEDERALTHIMQESLAAPEMAAQEATDLGIVKRFLPQGELRSGGHVQVLGTPGHPVLSIQQASGYTCTQVVQRGYTPLPMKAPRVTIDGVSLPLPGKTPLCHDGVVLAWSTP